MKYLVFFTDEAYAEAEQAVEFLHRVSPEAAATLAQDFSALESNLSDMPFSNAVIPFPGKGEYRRLIIEERYAVVFKIEGYNVYVETIIDCRTRYSWLLK
jgi:hypothetical protein